MTARVAHLAEARAARGKATGTGKREYSVRFQWTRAIACADGPSDPTTRHVLLTLAVYMQPDGTRAYPSIRTLATDTGRTSKTVGAHLDKAVEEGWIFRTHRGAEGPRKRGWRLYEYRATFPRREVVTTTPCSDDVMSSAPGRVVASATDVTSSASSTCGSGYTRSDQGSDPEIRSEEHSPQSPLADVDAREVLEHLNSLRPDKRGFRANETNLRFIRARLAAGISKRDLRAISVVKARQAANGEFDDRFLRPQTLFNATMCESYLGELGIG